ncbi:flagellin [Ammoniphilus sp. CFH 90114]|uniref:flagellin N-terminal helical domain-containing protein n=1 Tax=Ammoniphilus sp. CFH 90114 TaxID=2493665 RepID=UPI00100EFCA1|nr:flagellin [Ammoniphilus sp. CFH 90114]RXT04473.1 flagellin [Ammoniphilus sp. CFH 90114]
MRINNNISSLNTYRQLSNAQQAGAKSMEKLSTGQRINRAGDDAAGLAISEKMRSQIRGLNQASSNAQDGISMIQTAEGAMDVQHSVLQRMRELAVQASNGTTTASDRKNIQDEMNKLTDQIDQIANDTEFNGKKLLNGSMSDSMRASSVSSGALAKGITSVGVSNDARVGDIKMSTLTGTTSSGTASIVSTGSFNAGASTAATSGTKLTELTDSKGNTLGIKVGDEITVSATVGGEQKDVTIKVASGSTMGSLATAIDNALFGTNSSGSVSMVSASNSSSYTITGSGGTNTAATAGSLAITGKAGRENAITSFSITAKSSSGEDLAAFNDIGQQVKSHSIASDKGDVILKLTSENLDEKSSEYSISDTSTKFSASGATLQTINTATNKNITSGGTGNITQDTFVAVSKNDVVDAGGFKITTDNNLTSGQATFGTVSVRSENNSASLQIGANRGQTTSIGIEDLSAKALELKDQNGNYLSVTSEKSAAKAIEKIDDAINKVTGERSKLGAMQNRLEHTINNLATSSENMTAAESRIRDVDMAKEVMKNSKNNILAQAAQAMLAQANQQPQGVLQLLG